MPLSCSVIIGALCIYVSLGETTINIDNVGFGHALEVKTKSWQLNASTTDVLTEIKSSLSNRCLDDVCVHYRRHCESSSCTYTYGVSPAGKPAYEQYLTIKSVDAEGLADALGHVGIALSPNRAMALIEMEQESIAKH